MECKWCRADIVQLREPGTAGGPKLGYKPELCLWCNKLRALCTSGLHFDHVLDHRCDRIVLTGGNEL